MNISKINNCYDLYELQMKCKHRKGKQLDHVERGVQDHQGRKNVHLITIIRTCNDCGFSSIIKKFVMDENINPFTGRPRWEDPKHETKWMTDGGVK